MKKSNRICSYCQKPISDDEEVTQPYIRSTAITHLECAQNAALEEVADVYEEGGSSELEKLDVQSDLNAALEE